MQQFLLSATLPQAMLERVTPSAAKWVLLLLACQKISNILHRNQFGLVSLLWQLTADMKVTAGSRT